MPQSDTMNLKVNVIELDMPTLIRDMADRYYEMGNQLEHYANHLDRIESDPEYAQKIQEAEDQLEGDELLREMQTPQSEDPTAPMTASRGTPTAYPVDDTGDPLVVPPTQHPAPDMRH